MNATEMNAKGMVEQFAEMGSKLHKELAKVGEHFVGRTPVKSHPDTERHRKAHRPKPQMCFMNAQRFVLDHPDAKYYEGYWAAFVFPIHHGWVVLDGKVYDFTAEAADRSLKRQGIKSHADPVNEDYFGMHIPTEFIRESILESRMWEDLMGKFIRSKMKKDESCSTSDTNS